ncbi:hypothetical protein [Alloactinosynnema sp. L-07]|uniref:Imm1 family immunity protein n=1 Tax=Alloactinosynnema sp. L-07 TaxID=1653480 RepID=UPI00065F0127|nr:Imm1 family immunity protein [Alloactinosynnema sp. L-07]CRK55685.1 hypothetical protein [Alloactinosynnema sp. L-07]
MIPDILTRSSVHIDHIAPGIDLVSAIRDLNSTGLVIPWAWTIAAGPHDPRSADVVSLTVGIHSDTAMLLWADDTADYVPSNGHNTGWVTYHLAGIHELPVPPHAETTPDLAYEALTEFLETHARPACVTWCEAEA